MSSFLQYFGGKYFLAPWIVGHMPVHDSYVEVFGGAGHVLFVKDKVHHEVFNDKDDILIEAFEIIRDDKERFIEMMEWYPFSMTLRERLQKEDIPSGKFERVLRYVYLNATGRSGRGDGTLMRSRVRSHAVSYRSRIKSIEYFSERLSNVIIECLDYRDIFAMYDTKDTFFYCDPPYYEKEKAYRIHFVRQDHARLALLLKKIQGRVMVSYVDHPWIRRWYSEWNIIEKEYAQHSQDGSVHQVKGKRTELLIMNY